MDGGGGFGGMPPGLAQAIQGAITNAMSQQLGSTGNERSENGTTSSVAMSFRVGPDGQLIPSNQAAMQATANSPSDRRDTNNASSSSPANNNSTNNSSNHNNRNSTGEESQTAGNTHSPPAVDHPPPRMMAEVMTEYRRTQRRLDAHWDRLDTMLRDDPTFDNENDTNQHQSLFRQVTEVMHFLSHAQHALSDAMINLGTTPPRQLRARPFMIAPIIQSAVVQNVPIAVQVPSSGGARPRNTRPATTSTSTSVTATATTLEAAVGEPMETSESSSDGENASSMPGGVEQGVMQQLGAALAAADALVLGQQSPNEPTNVNTADEASRDGGDGSDATADIEVSVEPIVVGIEMGPEITIDSQGRVATSSNETSRGGSPPSSNVQMGATRRGGAPSAGMIQNMIQAALSNMGAVANVSVQEISPNSIGISSTSSSSSSNSSSTQPGQDSRARGNTQTQPTTSTRTRSSTQVINRPAGAMGPPVGFMSPNSFQGGPMGPVPNNNFDILLPCNSHHIPQNAIRRSGMRRENRRVRQQAIFQQQQRPRSASVPPRGPIRGNVRSQQAGTTTTEEGQNHGGMI